MPRKGRTYPPVLERIAAKCTYEDRGYASLCCIYTGGKDQRDYGRIGTGGRGSQMVHRITYESVKGEIPKGLEIDHLCRQHDCCNPDHLEAVTHAENMRRGIVGEVARARAAAVTHCPQGHEYTPENTKLRPYPRGGYMCRFCRECSRIWARDYYYRNRELVLERARERHARNRRAA